MAASFSALGVSLYLFNSIQERSEIMAQQSQRTLEISEEILSKDFSAVSKSQSNPMLPKYVAKGEIPQEFTMSRKEIERLLYDLAIVDFRVVMKKEELQHVHDVLCKLNVKLNSVSKQELEVARYFVQKDIGVAEDRAERCRVMNESKPA